MKQISDKDIINYLLSMYPGEEVKEIKEPKQDGKDIVKDLSNIMTEHYHKKKTFSMYWIIMLVLVILAIYILYTTLSKRY